ncbi:MAG: hypothetical protein NTW19_17790, partial [Planctomycetota bacterium]|nr:hypothetical protein [Planctomycetota bacterium]
MTVQGKAGRPQKPYRTTWGELIDGLARGKDERWRIIATGFRFTEASERLAVAKAKGLMGEKADSVTVS